MGLPERVDAAIDAALVNRIVGCVILIKQNGQEIYARAANYAHTTVRLRDSRPASLIVALTSRAVFRSNEFPFDCKNR